VQIHLITAVSVIKWLSLYEFTLWGRDLVSVVSIREVFLKKLYENYIIVGTLEALRNREVSVLRGSTVLNLTQNSPIKANKLDYLSKAKLSTKPFAAQGGKIVNML